jgi:hypothetical protein
MSDLTQLPAEQQLALLRRAWHDRQRWQGELDRLARYARLSPGMKADRARVHAAYEAADRVLRGILEAPLPASAVQP